MSIPLSRVASSSFRWTSGFLVAHGMRPAVLAMLVALLSGPGLALAADESSWDAAFEDSSSWVVRGQSGGFVPQYSWQMAADPLVTPQQSMDAYYQPGYMQPQPGYPQPNYIQPQPGYPQPGMTPDPFMNPGSPAYPSPVMQDPWLGGTTPYAVPAQPFYSYGLGGSQPVRFGWQSRYDLTWMPSRGTSSPNTGDFEMLGLDIEKEYTTPVGNGWVGSIAPQFNYRMLSGPSGTALNDLPGATYRFGLAGKLRTPTVNGWTLEGGFNPAIGTDFNGSLTSDAWMFDAHLVAFWQMNPQWMIALGAVYWDRVDDMVLPYAGVVYCPNDIWEFRLIFPKPRISVFLGTPWGIPTWLYAAGEYHVEAYQVNPKLFASETRVQFEDWRVVGGLRWEAGWLTSFVEAGYIFDQEVEYKGPAGSGFTANGGFIGRLGFRY